MIAREVIERRKNVNCFWEKEKPKPTTPTNVSFDSIFFFLILEIIFTINFCSMFDYQNRSTSDRFSLKREQERIWRQSILFESKDSTSIVTLLISTMIMVLVMN